MLLGILGPVALFLSILIAAWAYGRTKMGDVWERTSSGWQSRAERLEIEAKEQRELKHAALNDLAAERLKHDFTEVMKVMMNMADQIHSIATSQERVLALISTLERRTNGT